MKVDARLTVEQDHCHQTAEISRLAEELGFAGLWTGENKHDAFLPLAVAADNTSRIALGTAVAIAFSRSPMVVAQLAWDLQRRSRGRFILGLGTQVSAHVTRRFSMPWSHPAPRLHEYVGALKAIWASFQSGTRLDFRGEFYEHTLLTPNFDPGPIPDPDIPVYVSGVGGAMARSAGQYCDGFHVHPFHSAEYVRTVIRPQLLAGREASGRASERDRGVELSTSVFVVTGRDSAERDRSRAEVRSKIAFYASTPSYRKVLEVHGWEGIGDRLSQLARDRRWGDLPSLITDEMLDAFAIESAPEEVGPALRRRYDGLVDRVSLFEFLLPDDLDFWRQLARSAGIAAG